MYEPEIKLDFSEERDSFKQEDSKLIEYLSADRAWVDAKDSTGVWRLGISQKTEGHIVVLFDGWSSKYKESYCLHSEKVTFPRKHTRGYTG